VEKRLAWRKGKAPGRRRNAQGQKSAQELHAKAKRTQTNLAYPFTRGGNKEEEGEVFRGAGPAEGGGPNRPTIGGGKNKMMAMRGKLKKKKRGYLTSLKDSQETKKGRY